MLMTNSLSHKLTYFGVLVKYIIPLVCSGQLDLYVAQEAIRTNWIEAYEKYVGEAYGGR
jgi:hypothetical protein